MRKLMNVCALTLAFGSAVLGQTEPAARCPSILVTGPEHVTRLGDTMTFAVNSQLENVQTTGFNWTVSAGTITRGQGTREIEVLAPRDIDGQIAIVITATVEVVGLPRVCSNKASVVAPVSSGFHPPLIDEFGKLPRNDIRGRLDVFFQEFLNNRKQVGFVVLHVPSGSTKQRLKQRLDLIRHHVAFRKFPKEKIIICSEPGTRDNMEYTSLWRSGREHISYFCPSGVIL